MPATRHDDDAVVDPGVWLRDGGVSPESPLLGYLLGVAADVRFSDEKSCVDAEEDITDGFDSFEGGSVCLQGDWLVGSANDKWRTGAGERAERGEVTNKTKTRERTWTGTAMA